MTGLDLEKIRNIVVLMPEKHMGNLVVSLPAIMALRRRFAGRNFHVVVDEAYAGILGAVAKELDVIVYPRRRVNEGIILKRAIAMIRFIHGLRAKSPDLVVDLEGRHLSATMSFLSGAPLRVGRSSAHRSFFYNFKIDISPTPRHRLYRYIDTVAALGAETGDLAVFDSDGADERISLKRKLAGAGISEDRNLVCIHPGAGKFYKEWPSERFAGVADWLSGNGYKVVFIGGDGDRPKVSEVISLMRTSAYDLAGALSFGELISLYRMGVLYIGNDSGPLHPASLVGTLPVVGLYLLPGPERTWYPFTDNAVVLRADSGCTKCLGRHCTAGFACRYEITVGEVQNAVEEIMSCKVPQAAAAGSG